MTMAQRFYIEDAGKVAAAQGGSPTVTIHGWVHNKRSSGKIKFLVMRDGTGLMQGVLVKGECDDLSFEEFEKLTQETSVIVTGQLRANPRQPGVYEMGVQKLQIVQVAQDYPISPKDHGVEFLMENR